MNEGCRLFINIDTFILTSADSGIGCFPLYVKIGISHLFGYRGRCSQWLSPFILMSKENKKDLRKILQERNDVILL